MMLSPGVTLLGRAEDNDLVLTDIGVSRRHARIVVHAKSAVIEDMGSGNGTYFRGRRVQRQQVEDGDEVLVDPFVLSFRLHRLDSEDDGVTAELEDVDDDDTVRVSLSESAPPTEERPLVKGVAQLITLTGQRLEQQYKVQDGVLTLGRNESRDIVLFDPAASRNHAVIEQMGADFWLRDNGSANGTYVNASRVHEQCLRNGDKVRIGSTEFRFEMMNPVLGQAGVREEQRVPAVRPLLPRALPIAQHRAAPALPGDRNERPGVSGFQMAVVAGLSGFALVTIVIAGVIIALVVMDGGFDLGSRMSKPSDAALVQGSPVDSATGSRVAQLLERGMVHFDAGRYLDAEAQYSSVLQLVPNHEVAQRMVYRSCEQLLVDKMRSGLVLRNLPKDEQLARRTEALSVAQNAMRGKADLARAVKRLRRVLVFLPDDEQLLEALDRLQRQVGRE